MADDFYPFVDSGDPAPDNSHLTGEKKSEVEAISEAETAEEGMATFATRIAVYDDMLSTPRVIVISPAPVRAYLEEITNTVYRSMKEQGGRISLMVIREIVENFIHAHFVEPIISILDQGNTIRFADQGPGIEDKERAFEFGVTSADRDQKRYIRGTGAGFPMVQQYLENAGGAVSIEDNLGQGTVVTVSLDPVRVEEIQQVATRGGAVRGAHVELSQPAFGGYPATGMNPAAAQYQQQPWNAQQPQQWQQPGVPMQPMGQQSWPTAYPASPQVAPGTPQMQPQQVWGGYPQQHAAPMQQTTWQASNQAAGPSAGVYITPRGQQALMYLMDQTSCGPTDLVRAYGSSVSTWSRELETLQQAGFVVKQGQKRILTDVGRAWINEQTNRG